MAPSWTYSNENHPDWNLKTCIFEVFKMMVMINQV